MYSRHSSSHRFEPRCSRHIYLDGSVLDLAQSGGTSRYGLPTVGSSFDDFWVNTGGAWTTYRIGGEPSDFAGRFGATVQVVPLASTPFPLTGGKRHVQSVR